MIKDKQKCINIKIKERVEESFTKIVYNDENQSKNQEKSLDLNPTLEKRKLGLQMSK